MLPFALRGGFDLDSGELPVESVNYAEDEGDAKSKEKMAVKERKRGEQAEDKPEYGNLVRRDLRSGQRLNERGFDRRMHVGREIEGSFLGGVQDHLFQLVTGFRSNAQAERPDHSPH